MYPILLHRVTLILIKKMDSTVSFEFSFHIQLKVLYELLLTKYQPKWRTKTRLITENNMYPILMRVTVYIYIYIYERLRRKIGIYIHWSR